MVPYRFTIQPNYQIRGKVKQAVFRIRIRIRIDFGRVEPDPHWESDPPGFGSRSAKKTHKKVKKIRFSLLMGEDFCSSLNVIYGGLGITKLHFFIKKIQKNFSCKFFSVFSRQNP
jgi:hypothetical protein